MKTAKEWCESTKTKTAWLCVEDVKAIQLDAMREGMAMALEAIWHCPRYAGEHWFPESIMKARDNLKEIPSDPLDKLS